MPRATPDAAQIAVAIVIADIVHELRRARVRPIYRVHYGTVAAAHAAGVLFGWLAPASHPSSPKAPTASAPLLALTDSGRLALTQAERRALDIFGPDSGFPRPQLVKQESA